MSRPIELRVLRGSFMRFSNAGVAIIIAPLIACQGATAMLDTR